MNRPDISQMIEETRKHIAIGERAIVPGVLMRAAACGQAICGFWNFCRRVWWLVRMRDVYTSENFFHLVAGHGMGLLYDQSKILKMAAMAVLVAARILASVDQYSKLRHSWNCFLLAWRDQLTPSIKVSWEQNKHSCWSTSTKARIVHAIKSKLQRVQRIFTALAKVTKETFVLSMRMTDALESFYCSSETRNESMNLFFVNGAFLIDRLAKDQQTLVAELKTNEDVINRMFKKLNSQLNVDALTKLLPEQKTDGQKPKEKTIFDLGKSLLTKWKFEAASIIGMERYVEQPTNFFEEDPIEQKVSYIPDEWITRPSAFIDQKSF